MKNRKKYLIVEISECEKCDGTGITENELYEQFEEELSMMNKEELKKIIYEKGIDEFEKEWFWKMGYYKKPQMEVTCKECHGTGEIETKIEINEDIYIEALSKTTERRIV